MGRILYFEESLAQQFIEQFYVDTHIRFDDFPNGASLSPKLLIVAPNKRLSWQYHFRRAEVWRCIFGDITVVTSDTDEEKDRTILSTGEIVQLEQGKT